MRGTARFAATALIALALLALGITSAWANDETPPDKTLSPYFVVENADSGIEALPLKSTDVKVRVLGVIAEVVVTQRYTNEGLVPLEARYRFRHDLVRQALIEQIAPHQRLKMHRQAASRLAELDAAPALVAQHWLAGGSPREAMPWLLAAAGEALRLAAFSDVLRHLQPLLAFQATHPEALRLRAEALDAMGDPSAVTAYRAAADGSRRRRRGSDQFQSTK